MQNPRNRETCLDQGVTSYYPKTEPFKIQITSSSYLPISPTVEEPPAFDHSPFMRMKLSAFLSWYDNGKFEELKKCRKLEEFGHIFTLDDLINKITRTKLRITLFGFPVQGKLMIFMVELLYAVLDNHKEIEKMKKDYHDEQDSRIPSSEMPRQYQ